MAKKIDHALVCHARRQTTYMSHCHRHQIIYSYACIHAWQGTRQGMYVTLTSNTVTHMHAPFSIPTGGHDCSHRAAKLPTTHSPNYDDIGTHAPKHTSYHVPVCLPCTLLIVPCCWHVACPQAACCFRTCSCMQMPYPCSLYMLESGKLLPKYCAPSIYVLCFLFLFPFLPPFCCTRGCGRYPALSP